MIHHVTQTGLNKSLQNGAELNIKHGLIGLTVECGRGLNVDFNWMLAVSVACRTGSYIFVIVKFYV